MREDNWSKRTILGQTTNPDYPQNFSWRKLFHKLCFEQMIANLAITCDFKMMYEYITRIGPEISVLRVCTIDKTKLKSNQYWLMALVSKMPALQVLKMHKPDGGKVLGKDGYKFLLKGLTYMKENGRSLKKVSFSNMLGAESAEYLYPCLKLQEDLQVIDVSNCVISVADAKAIGKVLADFKNIRELTMNNCSLTINTVKDVADGLMRAKQLEIVKMANNPSMGKAINTVIYNLAFSPRIKFIDLEGMKATDNDTAEAIFKLINISGSIETLNLYGTDVIPKLTEDFFKAVGHSKSIKYLNLGLDAVTRAAQHANVAKAISMNAREKGLLEAVNLENWFQGYNYMTQFLISLKVSDYDHEMWYGDKNFAKDMKKDQLKKNLNFALKYLNVGGSMTKLNGFPFRPKVIAVQPQPEWPDFLHFAAHVKDLVLDLGQAKYTKNDMELIAFAIGENPVGTCGFKVLNLTKSPFAKEGAKLLAPALALNKSIQHLDLSSTKIGVSGIVRISEALQKNSNLKSLNLYRNILDVDGARAIGDLLKVNSTIEFLDVGHNRIRQTGLKAICDGILANPKSKLSQLAIRANFINDKGIQDLFDNLVINKK